MTTGEIAEMFADAATLGKASVTLRTFGPVAKRGEVGPVRGFDTRTQLSHHGVSNRVSVLDRQATAWLREHARAAMALGRSEKQARRAARALEKQARQVVMALVRSENQRARQTKTLRPKPNLRRHVPGLSLSMIQSSWRSPDSELYRALVMNGPMTTGVLYREVGVMAKAAENALNRMSRLGVVVARRIINYTPTARRTIDRGQRRRAVTGYKKCQRVEWRAVERFVPTKATWGHGRTWEVR